MDPAAIWVTAGGAALAVAVNVYFFTPRHATVVAPTAPEATPRADFDGPQEVRITVRDGYDPSVIEVRAGRPVRLVFRREEVAGCSDTVLLPEWAIVQRLPAHEDTAVEFMPLDPGEFEFTCGMQMLRGKIVVR
jgi:plastocyanin domain-containing protein